METVKKESFKVIGIKVRTTNENGQAGNDIVQLWNRFISEGIAERIPNKVSDSILSIYCNYESDYTKPYDTILGCCVSTLEEIPFGMVGKEFPSGNYAKFLAKGELAKNIVYNAWVEIWDQDLDRTYVADFEVYGKKAQNPEDAEVDIFVGIK